jgi:hypothetical protein
MKNENNAVWFLRKKAKIAGRRAGLRPGLGSEYGNKLVIILGHTSPMRYCVNGGHLARDTSVDRVD